MGIASKQEIPEKPKADSQPWSIRSLFPFKAAVSSLSKVFINPFEILLGYFVIIAGAAELAGRNVSWFFWGMTLLLLIAALVERHGANKVLPDKKK